MHTLLALALAAGTALAAPTPVRHVLVPGPHAPAARALPQGRGKASEPHPEIRRAMRQLENARATLNKAASDFGGHRVEAIKSIDAALEHLRQALAYDKK